MRGLLEGKFGFVTGAASGIGAAIALELGVEGAHVVLSGRPSSEAQANAIINQIIAAGGQAEFYPGDVTEAGFGEDIVNRVQKLGGRIDFQITVTVHSIDPPTAVA